MKGIIVFFSGLIAILYLLNIGLGIIEIIPDNETMPTITMIRLILFQKSSRLIACSNFSANEKSSIPLDTSEG